MRTPSTDRRQTHFQINPFMSKLLFGCVSCAVFCVAPGAWGQTKVTTWHYNNARTSANTTEKVLTPANVNVKTFGKLFTKSVDGLVVGHPLYLPDVNIPNKGLHNVVYVATMNDTVYAFDANSIRGHGRAGQRPGLFRDNSIHADRDRFHACYRPLQQYHLRSHVNLRELEGCTPTACA